MLMFTVNRAAKASMFMLEKMHTWHKRYTFLPLLNQHNLVLCRFWGKVLLLHTQTGLHLASRGGHLQITYGREAVLLQQ